MHGLGDQEFSCFIEFDSFFDRGTVTIVTFLCQLRLNRSLNIMVIDEYPLEITGSKAIIELKSLISHQYLLILLVLLRMT